MSDNNINNSFIRSLQNLYSVNKINKGIQSQSEDLTSGKKANNAEEDSVSISKSAKLRSQMAAYEQNLASADSASEEDQIGESLVALASANSTIIDTDMAKAQSESIRQKILMDTTTAMYAQANVELGQVFDALG